ncbi:MAG: serine/threonine-protein phosphatase [Prevotella sp.]|nr:serine/threonine-protein phosphatase [Prevotella sp.]
MLASGAAIAAIIITFLGFIAVRRKKHMKTLQGVNSKLQAAYDQLEETTKAKERIESELRIAREIQKRMLPHVFPRRRDVDLYAMMTPAKEVGGDLYAYALIDDMLYFCVGDVSGKGVPAALFMAEVTRMFRTLVDGKLTPGTIATRLNHALAEDNEQGMFVTMFIGLINLKTGHMEYCNAGHNPPLLDGEYMKMESNAPIGLWSEVEFEGEEVDDMHGKTLFVYTDGISEAENVNKEQFGDERLQALLKQDLGDARQTSETIHKAVADFVGDAEPSDDLTKMCIIMK